VTDRPVDAVVCSLFEFSIPTQPNRVDTCPVSRSEIFLTDIANFFDDALYSEYIPISPTFINVLCLSLAENTLGLGSSPDPFLPTVLINRF
jgi:hypothetical protein